MSDIDSSRSSQETVLERATSAPSQQRLGTALQALFTDTQQAECAEDLLVFAQESLREALGADHVSTWKFDAAKSGYSLMRSSGAAPAGFDRKLERLVQAGGTTRPGAGVEGVELRAAGDGFEEAAFAAGFRQVVHTAVELPGGTPVRLSFVSKENSEWRLGAQATVSALRGVVQAQVARFEGSEALAQFRAMVGNAPTAVIMADRDGTITYLNQASRQTLKGLQALLPCPVDELVGRSIDIFHERPEYQRGIIQDPSRLPHQARIHLGDEILDLLVSAIHDDQGNYIGPMLTWELVTEKAKLEEEMARVRSMMENAPINMMYADTDLVLRYMNPASENTLKKLQKQLPIPVANFVGTNIDIFHKVPEHQRKLLADPKNLPHTAQIQLGPETLELRVSAILGSQGEYLGPMVSWEVITEKLERERVIEEQNRREQEATAELKAKVDTILSAVQCAADGDLTVALEIQGDDAIGQLCDGLRRLIGSLRESFSELGRNAGGLAASSEELTKVSKEMGQNAENTSARANTVASGAEEVSRNVQTVAAASEEMGASIKEIARNAAEAARVATAAVQVADQTNHTVGKLGDSSAEVGQVIKVITSIAQQTNLLALNATIEAARAGEAGKGFAVVANEVKELAKETARATEDISQRIEMIQNDTRSAVAAIAEISTIIGQINEIQTAIASAVEEQNATTAEISRNVSEAARGSSDIAENIGSVAESARNTTDGASDTERAATELARMAAQLQGLVERFKL